MITYINGRKREIAHPDIAKSLLAYLRDDLDLTGAKNGCGIGACGACTVLVNNQPVRACTKTLADIVDKNVLTIEGMARDDGSLHPLQQAFVDAGAIQCGYCTPGMVLAAHAFLLKNHAPTREQIRKAISGNLCRCTGYQQIIDAIEAAAKSYR
jgi:aerobic-type carbon monoxide dehydrogenase small subunit (CoxS/CutS family)